MHAIYVVESQKFIAVIIIYKDDFLLKYFNASVLNNFQ